MLHFYSDELLCHPEGEATWQPSVHSVSIFRAPRRVGRLSRVRVSADLLKLIVLPRGALRESHWPHAARSKPLCYKEVGV
jgi:hypothetical protein